MLRVSVLAGNRYFSSTRQLAGRPQFRCSASWGISPNRIGANLHGDVKSTGSANEKSRENEEPRRQGRRRRRWVGRSRIQITSKPLIRIAWTASSKCDIHGTLVKVFGVAPRYCGLWRDRCRHLHRPPWDWWRQCRRRKPHCTCNCTLIQSPPTPPRARTEGNGIVVMPMCAYPPIELC